MMKRYTDDTEVQKFVFLTEQEFIMHFGQHYESSVLKANETKQSVIKIKNANGISTSIPLERANFMLEKYHRALKKKAALSNSVAQEGTPHVASSAPTSNSTPL